MRCAAAAAWLLLAPACAPKDARTEIVLQRFFGECGATYGGKTDVAAAEGECGIMTTLVNRFNAENPDIRVKVNTVAWPGYDQLSAQLAAGDPPDIVTMHQSAISDYAARRLIEPMDATLRQAGVDVAGFTPAARQGVTKQGRIWGLPMDNWAMLFHVNTALFAQAGLMRGGEAILPTSPDELLAQARQFKARTGKPYLIQSEANETAAYARNLYTYLMGQGAVIFPDAKHIRLDTPEARRVVALFRTLNQEGLSTRNQDYSAATASFIRGDGGVYLVGTWMIGDFEKEARTPGQPLYRSYAVYPYPQLYARDAEFVDGHAWVLPVRAHTPAQRRALVRLLKYMADNDFEWSRTGHLPAYASIIASRRFQDLPHRRDLARLTVIGSPLPSYVQRQFAIQDIVGDELASAISGAKPTDQALADAERRVDDLLFNLL
ncbi:MAG: extracellular solute-binding protein [Phenylobacterium sp.]|nr:MAG: extracellular solute-binding protein [Phenylobacterium sp.]